MKEKICEFVFRNKKNFILIMYLYAFLCAFFPYSKIANLFIEGDLVVDISFIISRLILTVLPFIIYKFCTVDLIKDNKKYNILLILPILIVCLNNFPLISVFLDKLSVSSEVKLWIIHIFKCFSASLMEEFVFRAVIFTLLYDLLLENKNRVLLSIIISSALFGLLHIVNLFAGEHIFYVVIQVGYSFLTGVLFSLSFLITKKMIIPILLHFIYNFGGLLQENGIISGQIWCVYQVIETAIISVIIGVFVLYLILKINKKEQYEISSTKG